MNALVKLQEWILVVVISVALFAPNCLPKFAEIPLGIW